MSGELFAGYPACPADEAVDPDGRLRDAYARLGLERLGLSGLAAAAEAMAAERRDRGVTVGRWADGRQQVRPLPLDPIPRIVPAAEWAALAAGVEQRHRALNAFLAEAYRAAGRRRDDADRAPQVVRAGVLPEWAVAHSPGRDPDAVGQAWPGQPRATVAGDRRAADDRRLVGGDEDNLRVPAGLGYALANRESLRGALPGLFAGCRPVDPFDAVPLLRAALEAAAPPGVAGTPRIAVLTSGESDNAWFEHRLLADALGAPLVRAADLWPRLDGGVEVSVGGERLAVDVLYRRFDDGLLGAFRVPIGSPLDVAADRGGAGRPARAGERAGQRAGRRRRDLRLGAGDDPPLPGRGAAARVGAHVGAGGRAAVGRGARPAARAGGHAGRRVRRAGRGVRPDLLGGGAGVAAGGGGGGAVPLRRPGAGGVVDRADAGRRRAACPGTWTCGCSRWPAQPARPTPSRPR